LEPDYFDEQGCQKFPVSEQADAAWESFCGPAEPTEEGTPDPSTWQRLLGFFGPEYASTLNAQAVVLLQDSVTTSKDGSWRAWGLIRNERSIPSGAIVTATLIGDDGSVLGSASGSVLVEPLRPGEPGPFQLSADVEAAAVASVKWTVEPTTPTGTANRDFLISQSWALDYGDRKAMSSYYTDPVAGPPYPFVLAGDIENLDKISVGRPVVVAAWVDQDLRVRWVSTAVVGAVPFYAGSAARLPSLIERRASAPFFLVVDDAETGPLVGQLTPILWAIGEPEGA
jgi:hypothetical protein